jgi:Protein of unknown function (DUF4013)
MNTDVTHILAAPAKDPGFARKYGLTVLASGLSFLLVPAVLLVGYLAQTVEHVSSGKKGLPDWQDPKALGSRGAICTLTGLYLLPAALILAISVMTSSSSSSRTFLGISLLSAFISLGGLVLGYVGLAFASAGVHSYVHSGAFTDLFNVPNIVNKLKAHLSEVGYLFGTVGIATLCLSVLNAYLGIIGSLVSLLASAFFALAMAYGVGAIYGVPTPEAPSLPPEGDSASESEGWECDLDGEDADWKPT